MTRLNTRFTYGKYNIMLSFELIFIAEVLNIKGTSTEMNECYITRIKSNWISFNEQYSKSVLFTCFIFWPRMINVIATQK